MIAASFRDHRFQFLQWVSSNLFPFEEVYDLDLLAGKYDILITDISDIPETYKGKVIRYGKDFDDFNQLKEYVPVMPTKIVTADVPVKDNEILSYFTQTVFFEQNKASLIVATLPVTQEDKDMFCDPIVEPAPTVNPVASPIQLESEPDIPEDPAVEELPEPLDIPEPAPNPVQTYAHVEPQTPPEPLYVPQDPVAPQQAHVYTPQPEHRSSNFVQQQPPQAPVYQPAPRAYVPQVQPYNQMMPMQQTQPVSQVRRASRNSLARGHSQISVNRVGNVAAFFGITPKSGVSGLVYMLASYLAGVDPSKQILVIDLDINQPGLTSMLINGFHLDPMVDTNVINMASIPDNDLSSALNSLVYEIQLDPVASEYSHIHCIFNTNISFADKRALSGWDFSTRIQQLSMYYDYVLVDCGRLQSTANYQLFLLRSNFQKIFVASGMTHASIQEFVNCLTGMTIDYKVVLNRTNRNITGAAIQRNLGRDITATIPNIVAIESLIRQGRTANSFGDRGFLSNLDQLRDGLGF